MVLLCWISQHTLLECWKWQRFASLFREYLPPNTSTVPIEIIAMPISFGLELHKYAHKVTIHKTAELLQL